MTPKEWDSNETRSQSTPWYIHTASPAGVAYLVYFKHSWGLPSSLVQGAQGTLTGFCWQGRHPKSQVLRHCVVKAHPRLTYLITSKGGYTVLGMPCAGSMYLLPEHWWSTLKTHSEVWLVEIHWFGGWHIDVFKSLCNRVLHNADFFLMDKTS